MWMSELAKPYAYTAPRILRMLHTCSSAAAATCC
jgi:hypothetical protein